MVKRLKKVAERQKATGAAGLLDSQLAQTVKDSAQQIWLAGLGAFSKAQGEGGKVFDTLMKEGMSLHRKTQSAAEERIGDVTGRMTAMAGQVGQQANASWDKLETIFEERTARALKRLGVPSADDLADLAERLDALSAAVASLQGKSPAAAKPATGRSGARQTAAGQKAAGQQSVAKPVTAKKASPGAAAGRKTTARKTTARKATATKAPAKKAAARKATARKTAARKPA